MLVPIVTVTVADVEFGFVRYIGMPSGGGAEKYSFNTSWVAAELAGTAFTSYTFPPMLPAMAASTGILELINAGPETENVTLVPPFAGTVTI